MLNSFASQLLRPHVRFAHRPHNHTFSRLEFKSLAFHFIMLYVIFFFLFVGLSERPVILHPNVHLNDTNDVIFFS